MKYHQGAEGERSLPDGSVIRITLAPNPSHLEFVNPVVQGMARALQRGGDQQDTERNTSAVVPILIHGDAAFAGEGVVAETLNLGRLPGYTTGGTVHLIANNQIGFTTLPIDDRSTRYASDLAKGFSFPIIHVNADDAEACMTAVRLAMAYRAEYHDDVVIDLVGYRRYGHNEGDEAGYTQPVESKRIKEHPTAQATYADKLVEEGVLSRDDVTAIMARISGYLRDAQDEVQNEGPSTGDSEADSDPESPRDAVPSVPFDVLVEVNTAAVATPEGFTVHPKLERQLARRHDGFGPDFSLDWGHAEALAFGSLLWEGVPVRLTGQDSNAALQPSASRAARLRDRATAHAAGRIRKGQLHRLQLPAFRDGRVGLRVRLQRGVEEGPGPLGGSVRRLRQRGPGIHRPVRLLGLGEVGQVATLAMLLPHGYEGQGPEHSSARLERFLQLCAEDNMRVVSPTTPAQYYHLLRRQAHVRPERPLVVMTPNEPAPTSPCHVDRLRPGGRTFQPVLDDPSATEPEAVSRLLLCSGKLYYDLQAASYAKTSPVSRCCGWRNSIRSRDPRSRRSSPATLPCATWSGFRKNRGTWEPSRTWVRA